MKLLIADDMEGISGVVDFTHVNSNHPEYPRFCRIMTGDINAAVEGAFEGGVDEVVVSDGHGGAKNVLIEELDERAKLNTGSGSIYGMMQGIDKNVDAVIYIGYHAMAGTRNGILAHTMSSANIMNVWLNGRKIGEIGINSLLAGHFGVPVLLIASDLAGCVEAREWVPGIAEVITKVGNSRAAAECLTPSAAQKLILAGVKDVVQKFIKGEHPEALKMEGPFVFRIEFKSPANADSAAKTPGVKRIDGRTLEFSAENMPAANQAFSAVLNGA